MLADHRRNEYDSRRVSKQDAIVQVKLTRAPRGNFRVERIACSACAAELISWSLVACSFRNWL